MITVYSKHNCNNCTLMKNLIKQSGFTYDEINIEENEEAFKFVKERVQAQSMPVIIIDDQEPIIGLDMPKLMKKLGV
ncbi:glutaredoxin family protein [Vaginisenegalia massiliensis]|uniref:glutaredoxin family protein n=1 Tax=Vaginisenegalia massiliensis TaxID=2058294 RepID=UPI000F529F73|nr:glutaredoxin domain-containing protein [Vaginisenegalia massiliensis]